MALRGRWADVSLGADDMAWERAGLMRRRCWGGVQLAVRDLSSLGVVVAQCIVLHCQVFLEKLRNLAYNIESAIR